MSNTIKYLVRVENLITLPDIYLAVKEIVEDPDASLIELANVISYDPAISAKVLKVANSSFYGQISEIDTINRAVSLLGTKTVHDTVLAISVSNSFKSISELDYDVSTFWQNSIMRAVVAKCCAKEMKIPEPDRLFTLGLLSDIGHMIMSICTPKLMKQVLQQHRKTGYPLYLYERSSFNFDAGELGADLLESWAIPNNIVSGIRYQNCPEFADEYKQEAAIIYCAGRLHPDEREFPNMLDFEVLKQLSMGYLDFDHIRTEAGSLYDEALSLFPTSQLKEAV
ncbi:MAG: HDOD domain-containing protein [Proteobacteria bacterium]|nr:HDOD domain-containing protein [Pseudomonadota bacterium]NOG60574.1 HDOD domain-containing protein [Pseudomonadota bacterium]